MQMNLFTLFTKELEQLENIGFSNWTLVWLFLADFTVPSSSFLLRLKILKKQEEAMLQIKETEHHLYDRGGSMPVGITWDL